jgi:Caspase domain
VFQLTLRLIVLLLSFFVFMAAAQAAKRVALIIGVQKYTQLSPLANPVRDAIVTADLLGKNGFLVHTLINVDHESFEAGLTEFERIAEDAEEAIVLYSGHGMTVVKNGRLVNALTATDSAIDCKTRTSERMVTMKQVLATIAHVPNQVLLFDACRNDAIRDCESTPLTEQFSGFQQISTKEIRHQAGLTRSTIKRGMRAINCLPSATMRLIEVFHERRIFGSS